MVGCMPAMLGSLLGSFLIGIILASPICFVLSILVLIIYIVLLITPASKKVPEEQVKRMNKQNIQVVIVCSILTIVCFILMWFVPGAMLALY